MSSISKKISKKNKEREKYGFISVEDLEKLKLRGFQLSEEIKLIDFRKNPYLFKSKSLELHRILTDLKKYKKYAKK